MKNIFILLFLLLMVSSLTANDDIDDLLGNIEHKTDLSQKTKIQNAGISQIFTRDDLRRMQVRYLKDILKSNYFTKYFENKFALPDPLTQGHETIPYKSSTIRVYIDNQEITAGTYGSGLIIYGDLDIGFADHIEIYTQSPTYEYSTETTVTLIKIYSKSILKDEGIKVEVNAGSYGASRVSSTFSSEISDEWSHLTYVSLDNQDRQNHDSFGESLSRDKESIHLFSSISNKNQRVLIDITDQQKDSFIGTSLDATPTRSDIDFQSIHIGYDTNINNFSFLISYDYSFTKYIFEDNITPIYTAPFYGLFPAYNQHTETKSEVYTTDIKYNFKTQNNKLTTGIKYRLKKYDNEVLTINDINLPQAPNNEQVVSTIFAEDKYYIYNNHILTFGIQYSDVSNNHSQQNDELYQYRFAYTFLIDSWISKTILAHTETSLEPYMVDSQLYITPGVKKPQEANYITQDIIYENQNSIYEIVMGYIQLKNTLLLDPSSNHLDNYAKKIDIVTALLRWTYNYNKYDKLFCSFDYKQTKNLYNLSTIKNYTAVIRNLNTYKKFDFFSELLYNTTNIRNENFYDLSLGIIYNHSENLNLSIKGENILDKAKSTSFSRTDPATLTPLNPLNISPIDRKLTISLEYLF